MKQLLFFVFAFCVISNTYAQMDCDAIPSCIEMGYTQDSCAGGKGIRCPFDENKFYCAGVKQLPDAPEPVITPEDWTAECADKIDHCTAYNNDCQCTTCEDDYNLADNTCVSKCDKSADTCAAESKIFNADTCTCKACPIYYEFSAATNSCERIACDRTYPKHCTTYNSAYEPCRCTACEDGFTVCFTGGTSECSSATCAQKCQAYSGQANTKASVEQFGNKVMAPYATTQFYVGDKNGDFGQGKWYLPSIGEWLEFYGTDTSQMTEGLWGKGITGDNKALIDSALRALANQGIRARTLGSYHSSYPSYCSSSESPAAHIFEIVNNSDGTYYVRSDSKNYIFCAVRCALLLKNIFNPSSGGTAPQIGDVMYLDKTYGSAEDYDGSKEVAGIIAAVSEDKRDVKIINLKELTFTSDDTVENFDPENPYSSRGYLEINWGLFGSDVKEIYNLDYCTLLATFKVSGCSCPF